MGQAESALVASVRSLFYEPEYSDLVIACQGRTWKVHRAIVCRRCEYFAKACQGQFKEASEGNITLHDDDPHAVEAMLLWLYSADYDDSKTGNPLPLLLNIRVHVLADKYDLPALGVSAQEKSMALMNAKEWAKEGFAQVCKELWTNNLGFQEELRSAWAKIIVDNWALIMKGPGGEAMEQVISSTGTLGLALCKTAVQKKPPADSEDSKLAKASAEDPSYKCQDCQQFLPIDDIQDSPRAWYHCPNCDYRNRGDDLVKRMARPLNLKSIS